MKNDDAELCEYFEGRAFMPFWRHELFRARDRRTIRRLWCVVGVLALALIVVLLKIGG